ncbi:regulatory protein, tetR family [Streptacidiphilus jiangxiensis]|uniref:Regulatory protein, tetR family n=2 Tax=Streptacidiphilus jiangxiensis TaxID=235985 RepID=A0A1H7YEM4_STRJI|nr:TetR family transcriptional regulator [Streptacidiphilus jiangxiensis]SEM44686.1 regulatory protein, tetR family [Streptacidiphilus jiangxiensis]
MDDAAILDAAARVMGRTGPARFTLAVLAAEVGLVPATLVQRFGSKRGLLLALSARTVGQADTAADQARERHASPLAALGALVADVWAAGTTPEEYANHLAFLCADLTDDEARARALAAHRAQDRATAALLAEAVTTGELRGDTDVTALTATVQSAVTGAGLLWSLDHRATLTVRRREALDAVLAPYRTASDRGASDRPASDRGTSDRGVRER